MHRRKQDCEAPGGAKGPDGAVTGKGAGGDARNIHPKASPPTPSSSANPTQATTAPASGVCTQVPPVRAASILAPSAEQILAEAALKLQNMKLAPLRLQPQTFSPNVSMLGGELGMLRGTNLTCHHLELISMYVQLLLSVSSKPETLHP